MAKWWMSVALITLGLVNAAPAQGPYLPSQGKPAVMPEPMPCYEAPPIGPVRAPSPGPSSPVSLEGDTPNAWSEDQPCDEPAVYFSVGFMALMRQKLGNGVVGVTDTASGGIDTGIPAPAGSPPFGHFHDINPRFNYGERMTIGYHCGTQAIELSGFYLSQNSSSKLYANPGQLDTFFNVNGDVNSFPNGFGGDNLMWLQADQIRTLLQTALGSAEANYRWWLGQDSNFSWSLGVRYLDLYERFSLFTGDDDLVQRDIHGNPNPILQATYTTTAHNRILAPQLGLEWNQAICCWLAFSFQAKGAWGVNFLDVDVLLKRGDGFVGINGHRSDTIFSQLYETGFFLDFYLMENARLRAGYDLLWAADVAEALGQLDFNLANTTGQTNNHGSIFYHGPIVELHLLF
jgi:hypothetical protein